MVNCGMKRRSIHGICAILPLAIAAGASGGFAATIPESTTPGPTGPPEQTELAPLAGADSSTAATPNPHMLTPYVVKQPYAASWKPLAPVPLNRPFSWTEGGTFRKHEGRRVTAELKLQYNHPHKGWDFLNLSW